MNNEVGERVTSLACESGNNRFKDFIKENRLMIFIIVLLLVKQLLVTGIPIFAHSGAGHDDRLMINMADSLINGQWLGNYSEKTLVKGIFFPLFLKINSCFGIPYSIAVSVFYSFADIVFILGIKKLFKTEYPLYIIFFVLIFNPISFADETFLRVYRNSLTAGEVLIVAGSMIGMYLNRNEKNGPFIFWAVLSGLGLAALWHTREDGIWIIPLVLMVIMITWVSIFLKKGLSKKEKGKKTVITGIPVVMLILSTLIISSINYNYYGIFTTNELNNSNFTDTIKLIYSVQASEDIDRVSVPRSTVEKLYEVSPSLNKIRAELDSSLDRWSWYDQDAKVREVEDGFFFWALREAISNAGYYQNAEMANEFYNQVNGELEAAFESGKINKRATMPSALMSPWRDSYWQELPKSFFVTIHYIAGFKSVETSISTSIDDGHNGIRLFEKVTNNLARYPGEDISGSDQIRVGMLNLITSIYQAFGVILFLLAGIGYVVISVLILFKKWRMKFNLLDFWLVLSGLLGSMCVLAIGVAYTDISAYVAISYWYLAGAYPLIIAFNIIALYKITEIVITGSYKRKKK